MSIPMDIKSLRATYVNGLDPDDFFADLVELIDDEDPAIWISRLSMEQIRPYLERLDQMPFEEFPLWGIPFAIKDNIDLAGIPTTAACPAFAYTPERSATVVQRLIEAGAIPVGKTNLDQFATGLVGVRSPYGVPTNALDKTLIPGGSSSGSAVSVAKSLVSFSLGTDTAGSGRVPAALNGIVGLKPSKGLLSCRGVVPACRSLDCVSIFAHSVADAGTVFEVAAGYDAEDPYSRAEPFGAEGVQKRRFGVPQIEQLKFFGNIDLAELYSDSVQRMIALGFEMVEIDMEPFYEAARLLYEGPWVAERYLAVRELLDARPDELLPVTRGIIEKGRDFSAADAFAATYRLEALRKAVSPVWDDIDFLFLPTAGLAPTLEAVATAPVGVNNQLGTYTNFVNLLDLCACAVPADPDGPVVPFGVTLLAPAFRDAAVMDYAARYLGEAVREDASPRAGSLLIAVCGAHMRGLPLSHQLTELGGCFVREAHTAPVYRMFELQPTVSLPKRPGLVRVGQDASSFELELWELPLERFGAFMLKVAPPLAIGTVELEDGTEVMGFVCEGHVVGNSRDISEYGGWKSWMLS